MAKAPEPIHPRATSDTAAEAEQQAGGQPQFHVIDKRFWAAPEGGESREAEASAVIARLPTFVEQLQEQLQEKDRLLRAHIAQTRNEQEELRRRLSRDLEQRVEIATGDLLTGFLPVLDNLDRALQSAETHPGFDALLEGIRLVRTQFLSVLARHGLKPLDRHGQPFDPSLDEAVTTLQVEDPSQHNLVLQEWEKGYTLHEKVLRPAKVAVGKKLAED
jgi:molecular chaperone GrpE (heat shock protein)